MTTKAEDAVIEQIRILVRDSRKEMAAMSGRLTHVDDQLVSMRNRIEQIGKLVEELARK